MIRFQTLAIVLVALALEACPPPRPLTEDQCPTAETRKNCGLCGSDPACAWCASTDPAQRGCFGRSAPGRCAEGDVVRIAEACERFADELVFLEE